MKAAPVKSGFFICFCDFREKQNEKADTHDCSYRVTDRRGEI